MGRGFLTRGGCARLVAGGLLVSQPGCRAVEPPTYAVRPPRVMVVPLALGTLTPTAVVRGRVAPPPGRDTQLASLESGYLATVLVAEGDRVAAGDKLVEIAAGLSRAQLDAELARLAQARARAAETSSRASRTAELVARGALSSREQEAAQAQARVGQAEVQAAQAAVAGAERHLAHTTVRAPFDGVVVKLLGSLGQAVAGGQPLIELADIGDLELHGVVTADLAAALAPGLTAVVTVGDFASLPGQVRAVAPAVDPAAGGIGVRIGFSCPERVRLGAAGSATVTVSQRDGLLLAPRAALLETEGAPDAALWVLSSDRRTVVRRSVELGRGDAKALEVRSGAKVGDLVVVQGGYGLSDGSEVEVAP